uniref:Uncharacterized protein n=1 Tax=Trypanosoma congolense (strain IL3000) TaxID=1068625 RepID=G0URM5_TRYCI|nr:conserved hypothetical protein [Trypanosoma congolense IL3000]
MPLWRGGVLHLRCSPGRSLCCRYMRRSDAVHHTSCRRIFSQSSVPSASGSAEDLVLSSTTSKVTKDQDSGDTDGELRGANRRQIPEHKTCTDSSTVYKTRRKRPTEIKVRRRAPWGMQQLRDSWSVDAMTKGDKDNMSERIHREYRYHPDEFRRHHIKFAALLTVPALLVGAFGGYFYHTGRPLWEADPQYILNIIRQMDTSPRSALHPYKLEGTEELPLHVLRYREINWQKRLSLECSGSTAVI